MSNKTLYVVIVVLVLVIVGGIAYTASNPLGPWAQTPPISAQTPTVPMNNPAKAGTSSGTKSVPAHVGQPMLKASTTIKLIP